jgi:hypothetical protein
VLPSEIFGELLLSPSTVKSAAASATLTSGVSDDPYAGAAVLPVLTEPDMGPRASAFGWTRHFSNISRNGLGSCPILPGHAIDCEPAFAGLSAQRRSRESVRSASGFETDEFRRDHYLSGVASPLSTKRRIASERDISRSEAQPSIRATSRG